MKPLASKLSLRSALVATLVAGSFVSAPLSHAQAPMAPSKFAKSESAKPEPKGMVLKTSAPGSIRSPERYTYRPVAALDSVMSASAAQVRLTQEQNIHPFDRSSPFPYIAIQQPAADVLDALRRGLSLPILGEVDSAALVSVDGTNKTPREFLDSVTSQAGLQWYFDGMSLHIVGTDRMKSRLLELGGISVDELRNSLDELRLDDPRFQISVSADADIARVQGPEPFVDAVDSLLKTLRERRVTAAPKRQVRSNPVQTVAAVPYSEVRSSASGPRVFRGQAR